MKSYLVKNNDSVFIGDEFVYEVSVNCYSKNYFCKVNSKTFLSSKPIDFVESFFINPNIEISCELIEAPLQYLTNLGYKEEEIKIKVKKEKK